MAADNSLNQSIAKAQKHYRSLFFLPSVGVAVAGIAFLTLLAGMLAGLSAASSNEWLIGLSLGGSLFAVNLLSDLFLSKIVLKDPIFVFRRATLLSLFGWGLWFVFILLGSVLGYTFGFVWWVKIFLLGYATLVTLRAVVFFSTLTGGMKKCLLAVFMQPVVCIAPFALFWARQMVSLIDFLPFIVVSPLVAVVSAYFFIRILNGIGAKKYGVPSMELFKAFMLNWIAGLNAPLERFFEKMGEDIDVEVTLLKFDSDNPKAAIITPLVHPGPFKNIGSSLLPSMLKEQYEKAYLCEVCVPLGLLGHELDAASQLQNQKIINQVIAAAKFDVTIDKATPLVRVSEGGVSTSCQLFGKTALISFTLAPKTTEDLPQELGSAVREEALRLGLESAIVVNAHNSLTKTTEIEASLEQLLEVASKSMRKALSLNSHPFETGAATVHPAGIGLREGMGTGGITAIAFKVNGQKSVYVILDGNNLVSGLREKILSALTASGFQESEVFTTDTHAASAVVVGRRGYHPLGEVINQEALIVCIKEAAQTASAKLESCSAGYLRLAVPDVRVIGGENLKLLAYLVDKTIEKAKQVLLPVFGLEGLILVLLLLVF